MGSRIEDEEDDGGGGADDDEEEDDKDDDEEERDVDIALMIEEVAAIPMHRFFCSSFMSQISQQHPIGR